jgi:hypothetical protein
MLMLILDYCVSVCRTVWVESAYLGHPEFPVNPKISENLRVAGGEKTSSQNGRSRNTLELVQNSCVCFKGTDTGKNII